MVPVTFDRTLECGVSCRSAQPETTSCRVEEIDPNTAPTVLPDSMIDLFLGSIAATAGSGKDQKNIPDMDCCRQPLP
jgi:hypothetical protein